jgi:hypothetical protein
MLLLIFLCSNVWAQDSPEKSEKTGTGKTETSEKGIKDKKEKKVIPDKDISVKPENLSADKENKQKTGKAITPGQKTVKKQVAEKPESSGDKPPGSDLNGSILLIDEGEYKYLRIPGYEPETRAKKNNSGSEGELVRIPDKIEIEETKDESGGLFGFSRETSDMLVKIFLGVMIFSIFLLYRIKSRRKSSSVLRRYPNR